MQGFRSKAVDEGCSRVIYALLLVILVFTPLAFGGVGQWEFLVVQALTIAVLILWLIRLWVSPQPQILWPPVAWAVAAFTVYAVIRYATSDVEYIARLEWLLVLVMAVLFFAILNHLYQQERVKAVSLTLVFLAMTTASYAVVQFLTRSNRVWYLSSPDIGRASGTFFSPNHFCAFLEMILPVGVAFLLVSRLRALTRILLAYALVVILAGITVTFSRAGYASTLAGLLVVLLVLVGHRHHRLFAGLLLAVLLIGGSFFISRYLVHSSAFTRRMTTAQGGLNFDVYIREQLWSSAGRMWEDHPWWGVGPAHYDLLFNEYRPQVVQLHPGWVHNDYLNLLVDWGLAGGVIVLSGGALVLAGIIRTWPRVRREEKDLGSGLSNRFAFYLGALGGLVALAVHSAVDFNLHVPADALLAVTLLALISSHLRFATGRYWHTVQVPTLALLTILLVTTISYLTWEEVRLGREAAGLIRASQVPDISVAHVTAREAAFRAEPMNYENAYFIGEYYRSRVFADPAQAIEQLRTALKWYERSRQLNPHYSLNYLRQALCLDYVQQPAAAEKFYDLADRFDPNGYYTAANIGWHYLQNRNFAAARPWIIRSLTLKPLDNRIARDCLPAIEANLAEQAGNIQ